MATTPEKAKENLDEQAWTNICGQEVDADDEYWEEYSDQEAERYKKLLLTEKLSGVV